MREVRWSGLPDHVLAGELSYLAERNHLPLAIIGPGPTINDIDPSHIPDEVIRFRMNMFFTEPTPRFGERVDGYFWANDLDVMYELMQSTHENKVYDYKLFFTPNEIRPERPSGKAIADKCRKILHPRYDHWWLIGHHPDVVRNMLLRPLPTQTFQAVATALILGFREIHLVGIDMYRNKGQRYAHDYSEDIKSRLAEKHRKPGYEPTAHSERRDLAFLSHLMKTFPDAKIYNASSVSPLKDVLPDSPIMHGTPIEVPSGPIVPRPTGGLIDPQTEVQRLSAEVAALRSSRSFRVGQAIFKPAAKMKQGLEGLRSLPKRRESDADPARVRANGVPAPSLDSPAPKGPARPVLAKAGAAAASALPPAVAKKPVLAASEVELLAICHETSSKTGGYRPIKNYVEETRAAGRDTVLLDLRKTDPSQQAHVPFPKAKKTIINSIAAFEWKAVNDFLAAKPDNVFLYLHEMDWIFERIQREQPELYKNIVKGVQSYPVLCVSKLQQDYIERTFSPPYTKLVYNVASDGNLDLSMVRKGPEDTGGEKTILMVGTIQRRKGPELFGQVADLAKEKGLPYRFIWAGHQTEPVGELSENVEWIGHQPADKLQQLIRQVDRFMLTSWDDPFPLSCLEALSWGVPIVSYHYSGVCEIIEGMPGCGVFHTREPGEVLKELQRAIGDPADHMRLFFHARPFIDCNHFIRFLDEATASAPSTPVMA
ncbi:glycosyltransferase family 4 protein [Henriciella aquimarina]|uniref:glycosyltransferase family 4 protein n=1 Tax=Henriciella aquimarina TaxID=545261 RepID=UPI000A051D19|nr:glycosyltransferase family 4 protein [Henriciella aquimarina]